MDSKIYKKIKVQGDNLTNTLGVCIGKPSTQLLSLDGKWAIVKTTQSMLNKKRLQGMDVNIIFPVDTTITLTYDEAYALRHSSEFLEPSFIYDLNTPD